MINLIIYLGDVISQNQRVDVSGVCYKQYGASLISHRRILRRIPLFWGRWENATKKWRCRYLASRYE